MLYRYDQLHRIVQSRSMTDFNGTTFENRTEPVEAYDETYTYDPNGNLLTLKRHDEEAALKDDFTYNYYANTNRLRKVKAVAGDTYEYDAIGNLIKDNQQGTIIRWTPYGKVHEVNKGDSVLISFRYDPSGNRVEKKVTKQTSVVTTHYVRDASGNVMGIYSDEAVIEQPIYGSSRVGSYKGGSKPGHRTLGYRNYELGNHLGNVLANISDRVSMSTDETVADVVNTTDYYPFGLEMSGRKWGSTQMRNGFNSKEKDDDGEWGSVHYDYGFRIYDPSIAKFLSVDPLTASYPMLTPYQFASNIPIAAIDLDGLESKFVIQWLSQPHGDGSRTVIKTETLIKPELVHPQAYAAGLAGKVAVTETYYYDNNNNYLGTSYHYEIIDENWPKPSAYYDYTKGSLPGKTADDKAFAGYNPGLWALLLARDVKAPDNAGIIQDLEVMMASQGLPLVVVPYPKHIPSRKVPWEKQIEGTVSGPAKFKPGENIDELLKEGWNNGVSSSKKTNWRYYKADRKIGANEGKETEYLRIEGTEINGKMELHGHPVPKSQYDSHTKKTKLK